MAPTIRPLEPRDIEAAAATMARAFGRKEPFLWLEPEEIARPALMLATFGAMLTHVHRPGGGSEVAADGTSLAGCAIWSPPGSGEPPLRRRLRAGWSMIRALGPRRMLSISGRGKALEDAFRAARPKTPHWYLVGLGVKPDLQGRGIGAALLRSGLERCDREGAPAYLECLGNLIPYYEGYGFEVRGQIGLPPETASQFGMMRTPRGR